MKLMSLAIVLAVLIAGGLVKAAEVDYGICRDTPAGIIDKSVIGLRFGLPMSLSRGYVEGGELSLFCSGTDSVNGFKYTLIGPNLGTNLEGCEIALYNRNTQKLDGVQIGLVNSSGKNGVQIGLVNDCRDNAKFQLGLLNFNKKGFFPWMIIVNFSEDFFD